MVSGNIPLAYVLRENNAAPAHATDPHDDYDGDTDRELITRAPHTGQYWRANNKAMCRLLKKICQDTPAYTYISNLRTDGRAAWRVLMQTYLGPQHTQLQAAIYEAKLQNSSYDGESQKFTYDKYCEIHQLAHTRLSSLEGQGYHGIDEGTKIRHFLQGIKTDKLKTTVELVRGNPDYATFEAVARRIKDSVVTLKPIKPSLRRTTRDIAAVNKQQDEPFPDVEADMTVEDKFYSPIAWRKLSKAKKKGVLKKRKQRQSQEGGKSDKKPKAKETKQIKALEKKIQKMSRKISAFEHVSKDDDSSDASDSDSDEEEAPVAKRQRTSASTSSNREHAATSRKKKSKQK